MMKAAEWYEIENADEVPSPALLVYPERIQQNLEEMVRWAGAESLRPHVKTHKLPQVVAMKLAAGINKFKTSTIAEAEMTASAGGRDVMLAYQPVGPQMNRLLNLQDAFPETVFSTIVDDPSVAQALSQMAESRGAVVNVFIDLDVGMHRTGISIPNGAKELCELIDSCPGLHLAGLHAYDGHIHDVDLAFVEREVEKSFGPVWELKRELEAEGIAVPRVVGCGTVSSKIMAEKHDIEVSAGTSVLWDSGQPTFNPPLEIQSAAVLLVRVISHPGENDLCVDLGHKAVASEMSSPRVRFLGLEDATEVMHSEEHMVLRSPNADRYQVGDVLYAIPTHICPTVALHQAVWAVTDHRATESWPVVARARKITI